MEAKQHRGDLTFGVDPIHDLCNTIRALVAVNECFGFLVDGKSKKHQLFATDRSEIIKSKYLVSLDEVLNWDARLFSRRQRMTVATVLTSSLLELSQTLWLAQSWSRRDIYFVRPNDGSEIIFHQPYIIQDFKSSLRNTTKKNTETQNQQKDAALRLFLRSLGIVLIELCFGTTIERELHELLNLADENDSHTHHHNALALNNDLELEDGIYNHDPTFSVPVQFCLHPPYMRMIKEGKYDSVIEDFHLQVAKPLHDETLSKWPGTFMEPHV